MGKIIKTIIRIFINILCFSLSLLIPRTNKIWIIGGWFGKRFADNSSYFYQFLSKETEYRAIWISRSKKIIKMLNDNNFEAYFYLSIKGLFFSLRAKYHIIDQSIYDINPFTSHRAKKVNLWHGFPLKNIGKNINDYNKKKFFWVKFLHNLSIPGFWYNKNVIYLGTSSFSICVFMESFEVKKKNFIEANYPRNDFLLNILDDSYIIDPLIQELVAKIKSNKRNNKKIVLYLPTFRDSGTDFFLGESNFNKIKKLLLELFYKDIILITKFHFAENNSKYKNILSNENLINLPTEVDIYPLLKYGDILVTDYSSVYFDYLFLDRPIIFFPYDLNFYINKDRGLNFEYNKMTPGIKVYTIEELIEVLKEMSNSNFFDSYSTQRNKIKRLIFSNKKGSRSIIHQIENIIL